MRKILAKDMEVGDIVKLPRMGNYEHGICHVEQIIRTSISSFACTLNKLPLRDSETIPSLGTFTDSDEIELIQKASETKDEFIPVFSRNVNPGDIIRIGPPEDIIDVEVKSVRCHYINLETTIEYRIPEPNPYSYGGEFKLGLEDIIFIKQPMSQAKSNICNHEWIKTPGFNELTFYEDCKKCGAKKEEL